MTLTKRIHNLETGEIIDIELTAEEIAQLEQQTAILAEAEAAKEAKRTAALAKLEALGLDEDDLKALGL